MQRFNSDWFKRILRNTAEVSSDGGTVIIHEPAEIVEVAAPPDVAQTLGAASVVVDMAADLARQNAPVDRTGEVIALLSEIRDDMKALRNTPTPAPVVVIEEPEPEDEPDPEPEIIVAAGDIKKEEITEVIPPSAPPTKRKRNWL